ncbi:hypothetical protein [Paracoccus marcusii]
MLGGTGDDQLSGGSGDDSLLGAPATTFFWVATEMTIWTAALAPTP